MEIELHGHLIKPYTHGYEISRKMEYGKDHDRA